MVWQKLQRVISVAFLIAVIGSLITYQIFGDSFDLNQIRPYLKEFSVWAPIIFIILYTLGTFFIPSTPFMLAAGILFGFEYGLLYTILSGFFSSVIIFYASRKFGKEWVEKILKYKYLKYLDKYNERLGTGAVWDLIILRITPIMPFNALNILMGVSKIKTKDYIIGTLLGLMPSNVLTVYIGAFITKIF
ncbi:MAG: TVP38/TMEM64 family protein [Candidatus Zambryskibacteria bacterium]